MKYIAIFMLALIVSGCEGESRQANPQNLDFDTVCLDGVKYYVSSHRIGHGGFGFMAPVYDAKTRSIVTCYN